MTQLAQVCHTRARYSQPPDDQGGQGIGRGFGVTNLVVNASAPSLSLSVDNGHVPRPLTPPFASQFRRFEGGVFIYITLGLLLLTRVPTQKYIRCLAVFGYSELMYTYDRKFPGLTADDDLLTKDKLFSW